MAARRTKAREVDVWFAKGIQRQDLASLQSKQHSIIAELSVLRDSYLCSSYAKLTLLLLWGEKTLYLQHQCLCSYLNWRVACLCSVPLALNNPWAIERTNLLLCCLVIMA